MLKKLCAILFLLLAAATPVLAQDDDFGAAGTVVVEKAVNLRRDPSTARPRIDLLAPGNALRLVDPEPVNGFYRVVNDKGELGWVWAKNVRVEEIEPVPGGPDLTRALAAPCAASLEACPATGCAAADSPDALLNLTKRRVPADALPIALSFDDFRRLQAEANPLVNQGLPLAQDQRDRLKHLAVSAGQAGEGTLVKVRAFIAHGSEPHDNTGESVNCRLRGTENNDLHISIVRSAGEGEFDGIVVEMIPQGRAAAWSQANLRAVRDAGRRVLVVGALFYDNKHLVNSDAAHPLGSQPKRFSLWEIHPITQFYVCMQASNNCSTQSTSKAAGWKPLEEYP